MREMIRRLNLKFDSVSKEDTMEKIIGRLQSKSWATSKDKSKTWLNIEVNGVTLSAWPPLSSDMDKAEIGTNIEVEYETKSFKGKTYHNASAWAIQGDNVPPSAPVAAPQSSSQSYGKTYGKSPEDRMGATVGGISHDAAALIVPWIEAAVKKDGAGWFTENWENIAKAHANLTAAMVDATLDYLSHGKG